MRKLRRMLNQQGAAALLAAMMLCYGSGCVTEPVTGRQRLILTSMSQETNLGREAWTEMQKERPVSQDAAKTAAVHRVGLRISQIVKQPGFEWEFKVFASPEANAFCLPGGKVGVYEGLFKHVANDGELAAVVAHEIAHATARHGGERMTHAMAVGLAGLGLAVALETKQAENRELWMAAFTGITTVGVVLPYSRRHEYEADEIGALYMAQAGYDPRAAVSFWSKFSEGKQQSRLAELLSTHPVDANRIQNLQRIMPKALSEYEKSKQKVGFGETY